MVEQEKDPRDFKPEDDLDIFFENFIKRGTVIEEDEITPGFKIAVKVLDTGELLTAESVLATTNPHIPYDIIQKVRAASILSQAIIRVNGIDVEKEGLSKEKNHERRTGLYSKLLKMPALLVQKAYELYIKAVKKQNEIYGNQKKMIDNIENF
jgi:hypothetical protein